MRAPFFVLLCGAVTISSPRSMAQYTRAQVERDLFPLSNTNRDPDARSLLREGDALSISGEKKNVTLAVAYSMFLPGMGEL